MTEDSRPWVKCNRLMSEFDYEKRLAAWIWAARLNTCSFCQQPPHKPCRNMTDVKRVELGKLTEDQIRETVWPHTQRVDWDKLFRALVARGYKPKRKQ